MKRWLVVLFLAALLPAFVSCRRGDGRAARPVRSVGIEAVEGIDLHGLAGADLTLLVRNGSRMRLALYDADLELCLNDTPVAGMRLAQEVFVPRRSVQRVVLRWDFRLDDPLTLYALSRRLGRGEAAGVTVNLRAAGRSGPAPVHIRRDGVPLSDFLRIFGIDTDELKNYLNE